MCGVVECAILTSQKTAFSAFSLGISNPMKKTKILFSSNVPVSRFLALRGPTPAPCCAGQVVIPSGFTPGSGPARGLSEGGGIWKANGSSLGHLLYIAAEGLRVLKKVGCESQSVTSASLNFPRASPRTIRGCSFVAMSRRIAA